MRIAAVLLGMIAAMSAISDPATLRIVSYNIHHGEGTDGAVDLDRIAAIVGALEPDVVCLQEVDRDQPRSQHLDTPAELGARLGMTPYYGVNLKWEGGDYGNATLTALPVTNWENLSLPGPEDAEPRGILRTTIQAGDVTIDVLNTHLGLKSGERTTQTDAIVGLVRDVPTILAGDLNDRPNSVPLKTLYKVFADFETAGATYPAGSARARIDYILVSGGLDLRDLRPIDSDSAKVASDHLPIVAIVGLPTKNAPALEEWGVVDNDDERLGESRP